MKLLLGCLTDEGDLLLPFLGQDLHGPRGTLAPVACPGACRLLPTLRAISAWLVVL